MKMKICFLIPYFSGRLPQSFSMWLSSVAYNDDVDFIFFSNIDKPSFCPDNLIWHVMLWETMKEKIDKTIGFPSRIKNPYKLCDFKPAYGDIFSDFILSYDFWGWCDIDLVFGKIRSFVTDEMLVEYEKIGLLGHCVLIKNTDKMRNMYKQTCCGENAYKTIYSLRSNFSFDEGNGGYDFPTICNENNVKTWYEEWFCDVYPDAFEFCYRHRNEMIYTEYICFNKGHVFAHCKESEPHEVMYVHFQSRHLRNQLKNSIEKKFYIKPNQIDYDEYIDDVRLCNDKKSI